MPAKNKIYFSYAWGDEQETGESREKIVNELYESLKLDGYEVVRDKQDLGYRGLITGFMEKIGRGRNVVVVISAKYLKSPYCMFELYEIARNCAFDIEKFRARVLPIVVEKIDLRKIEVSREYEQYWQEEFIKHEQYKNESSNLAIEWFQQYDRVRNIYQQFSKLSQWLVNMNMLNPQMLAANNFQEIKQAIGQLADKKMVSSSKIDESSPPETEDKPVFYQHLNKYVSKTLGRVQTPELFLGREEELFIIHKKLSGNGDGLLLLVNGEGGIGKTTLASAYFKRYSYYYKHLAWVFAEQGIASALLSLVPLLGIKFAENETQEQQLAGLLSEMRSLQKPCLLVIDNANEVGELDKHYSDLRACPNFHILLTSRISIEQIPAYKVGGLPQDEALAIFKTHYKKHNTADDVLFQQLYAAVNGNTLVLELLAKTLEQLNRFKSNYTLAAMVNDLLNRGLFGLAQTATVDILYQGKGQLRREKPENIIDAMYDLADISENERKLLSVFAVLPAESLTFAILEILLAGEENIEESLRLLAQKGWLEYDEITNSFKTNPIIQSITRKKNRLLFEDCAGLVYNLTDKLEYEPGTGHLIKCSYEQASIFARYGETALVYLQKPEYNLPGLCDRMGSFYGTIGYLEKALDYYEECNRFAKELYASNPQHVVVKRGLAISCGKLGSTHATLGNLEKALAYYEEYNLLAKELYASNPQNVEFKNDLAISYQYLGSTHATLGDLEKALAHYEEYNRLKKELYTSNPQHVGFKNGLAISYSKLGSTYTTLGNPEKALGYYEECNRLEKELYASNSQNVEFKNDLALSCQWLGYGYEQNNEKEKAILQYQLSKQLLIELVRDAPDYLEFQNNLDWITNKLNGL